MRLLWAHGDAPLLAIYFFFFSLLDLPVDFDVPPPPPETVLLPAVCPPVGLPLSLDFLSSAMVSAS